MTEHEKAIEAARMAAFVSMNPGVRWTENDLVAYDDAVKAAIAAYLAAIGKDDGLADKLMKDAVHLDMCGYPSTADTLRSAAARITQTTARRTDTGEG